MELEIVAAVDRKSKDKTEKIIKKYADVFFKFDFNNNFSEIRNELIKRSHGEWILISDGHEVWRNIDKIPQILLNISLEVNALAFLLEMSPAEGATIGQQLRLFKNDPAKIYYEGAVHNKLNIDDSRSFAVDMVSIFHDRGLKKRGERFPQRQKMIVDIFEKELKEKPNSPRANFYLGTYYLSQAAQKDEFGQVIKDGTIDKAMLEKAIPYIQRYISVSDFYEEKYLAKWYLAQAFYWLGDEFQTKAIAAEMFEQMFELPLAQGILGELYLKWHKDTKETDKVKAERFLALAEFWFKNALQKKIPFVSCFFPKAYFTYLPWDRLTEVYSRAGRLTDAIFCAEKTLAYPDYPETNKVTLQNCHKEWVKDYEQQTGIRIGGDRTGDRKHDNVYAIDTSSRESLSV